jgi:hypothetical protein
LIICMICWLVCLACSSSFSASDRCSSCSRRSFFFCSFRRRRLRLSSRMASCLACCHCIFSARPKGFTIPPPSSMDANAGSLHSPAPSELAARTRNW